MTGMDTPQYRDALVRACVGATFADREAAREEMERLAGGLPPEERERGREPGAAGRGRER